MLPEYLKIDKDITDMIDFRPLSLTLKIDPQLLKKVGSETEKPQKNWRLFNPELNNNFEHDSVASSLLISKWLINSKNE